MINLGIFSIEPSMNLIISYFSDLMAILFDWRINTS